MTHAFAKDSHACAVCLSWGGERGMSEDMTLIHVASYSVEGACRTAVSHDYGRITKSYHTCEAWSPIPTLKSHGARHSRSPGPSAAMAGILAATPVTRRLGDPVAPPPPVMAPATMPVGTVPVAASRSASAPLAPTPSAPIPPARVSHASTQAAPVAGAPSRPTFPPPAPSVTTGIRPVAVSVEDAMAPDCASSPLDVDKTTPTARVLYAYWHRLRGDRDMPRATEIDTARIRDCLSRLCLFAPTADGRDFEYRSCGRSVARRFPTPLPGRRLSECHDAPVSERLRRDLRACLDGRVEMALLVRGDPILPGQRFVELLLPLADADGVPALVLAYRHVPGG